MFEVVIVIDPPVALGDFLDFDSDQPRGWPDAIVSAVRIAHLFADCIPGEAAHVHARVSSMRGYFTM